MTAETLLIPVEFPDPDPLPSTFVGGFTTCEVVLLGVYETPADLDPDARKRRETEAYHTLYSLANQFVQRGEAADVELVMGEDVADAPATVAEEREVDAILVPNPITTFGRLLVPVRDETFAEPIADFVGSLNHDVVLHTTLFHVADDETEREAGAELLSAVRDRLIDADFPDVSIDTEVVVDDDPAFAIGEAESNHDLIVMGETSDPPHERVFGKTYDSVAERTDLPVVVVREHR